MQALAEVAPYLDVVRWWRQWKRTHDRGDVKHNCCQTTQRLFNALDEMERDMLQPKL